MTSSSQTLSTVTVYDYLMKAGDATATKPAAVANAEIRCTLTYDRAVSQSPVTNVAPITLTTTTDNNGYWQFNLVPNASINPSGTLYVIQTPYSTFQVNVAASPATQQASSIVVNTPSTLGTSISATGNLTVGGTLAVTGAATLSSTLNVAGNARFAGPDPWYDVTHPSFGADSTGVVDSQPAIQAAVNLASSSVFGPKVFIPAGTYKLDSAVVFPAGGSNSVIICGEGDATKINPSGAFAAFSFTAGSHADTTFEQFQINGGTNAISHTSSSQVIRLSINRVRFTSCNTAINIAGAVIGGTFRQLVFSNCTGHVFNHNGTSQINNFLFDWCWFQCANFTTYVNLPATTAIVDDINFHHCLFEGPFGAAGAATMILGQMTKLRLDRVSWGDFSDTSTNLPLIKTVASATAAPQYLSADACDFTNGNGPIFTILAGNTFPGSLWTFQACRFSPKTATSPFNFTSGSGIQSIVFEACNLTVAQSPTWVTPPIAGQQVTLLNCLEAGVNVPFTSSAAMTLAGLLTVTTGGLTVTAGKTTLASHIKMTGTVPTLGALQTGVNTQSISGNDTAFQLNIATTGTPPGAGAAIAIVNFNATFTNPPAFAVSANGWTSFLFLSNWSATTITINASAALPISSTVFATGIMVER